jgi:hypothetical protein
MTTLPTVGDLVFYRPAEEKDATFRVVEVNSETGCIYLKPEFGDAQSVFKSLTQRVSGKHGKTIDALAYAYIEREDRFAVNVAWDAWTKDTHPVGTGLDELTRMTQEFGEY